VLKKFQSFVSIDRNYRIVTRDRYSLEDKK